MKDFQQIDYCTSAQDYITCMKAQVLKMLFFCLFVFFTPLYSEDLTAPIFLQDITT